MNDDELQQRGRIRSKRFAPVTEEIDVRTGDGWSLRAEVHEPKRPPIGVAVLAHAMMTHRSEFHRPAGAGLARFFVDRDWRVVAFDFRGHGGSFRDTRRRPDHGYDDFVLRDLPPVCSFAHSRERGRRPVVLVGHSLGGHAGLAAQGQGLVDFDGIVAVGANVWLPELEPSPARWLVKRAAILGAAAVCRRVGHFPARALRLGSDDETRQLFDDFERFARTGAWTSADGGVDYLAALSRVVAPVLQVTSDGDRLECPPECGARFVARCGGPCENLRVTRADDGGPPPSHMGLVTSGKIRGAWERVEAWMRGLT